jgi:hypothetical protein
MKFPGNEFPLPQLDAAQEAVKRRLMKISRRFVIG